MIQLYRHNKHTIVFGVYKTLTNLIIFIVSSGSLAVKHQRSQVETFPEINFSAHNIVGG